MPKESQKLFNGRACVLCPSRAKNDSICKHYIACVIGSFANGRQSSIKFVDSYSNVASRYVKTERHCEMSYQVSWRMAHESVSDDAPIG